jgi:hypothetical protein
LLEQPPLLRELRPLRTQIRENSRLAGEYALPADLDRAVGGEQIRRLRPKALIGIKPVSALQIRDLVLVVEKPDLARKRRRLSYEVSTSRRSRQPAKARPRCPIRAASKES